MMMGDDGCGWAGWVRDDGRVTGAGYDGDRCVSTMCGATVSTVCAMGDDGDDDDVCMRNDG